MIKLLDLYSDSFTGFDIEEVTEVETTAVKDSNVLDYTKLRAEYKELIEQERSDRRKQFATEIAKRKRVA
jgi:hypothetical protein